MVVATRYLKGKRILSRVNKIIWRAFHVVWLCQSAISTWVVALSCFIIICVKWAREKNRKTNRTKTRETNAMSSAIQFNDSGLLLVKCLNESSSTDVWAHAWQQCSGSNNIPTLIPFPFERCCGIHITSFSYEHFSSNGNWATVTSSGSTKTPYHRLANCFYPNKNKSTPPFHEYSLMTVIKIMLETIQLFRKWINRFGIWEMMSILEHECYCEHSLRNLSNDSSTIQFRSIFLVFLLFWR